MRFENEDGEDEKGEPKSPTKSKGSLNSEPTSPVKIEGDDDDEDQLSSLSQVDESLLGENDIVLQISPEQLDILDESENTFQHLNQLKTTIFKNNITANELNEK